MSLTKEERDKLPDHMFAWPEKRKLPMNDENHTKLAWDQVDRTQGMSESERNAARVRLLRRARELGLDTKGWNRDMKASSLINLFAMSMEVPEVAGHPNRMPFSGVVTFVDRPSDLPVGGGGGKLTYLPKDVAQRILPSLLGMAIDYTEDFSSHDPTRKLGVITGADIVGDEVQIEGYFYALDFPQECARIKAEKEDLGFSYEIQAQTRDMGGNLLQIVGGMFTGAAVLYKDKAAYQSTSLAAKAEQELEMDLKELTEAVSGIVKEAIKPLAASVEEQGKALKDLQEGNTELKASAAMREKVRPHAEALRNCAASMEAAGIGHDPNRGHIKLLHNMAASMEAEAASGRLPQIYRDHDWTFHAAGDQSKKGEDKTTEADPKVKALEDQIAALSTQVTDLKAAAVKSVQNPGRTTVSSEVTALLAKGGIANVPDGGLTEAQIDTMLTAAGVTGTQNRIAAKMQIANSGLLKRS